MAEISRTPLVLFNGDAIVPPLTGIGLYAHELRKALLRLHVPIRTFTAMRWLEENESPLQANASLQHGRRWLPSSSMTLGAYLALRDKRFKRLAQAYPEAVLHSPNFLPLPHDGPVVITIHDLAYVRFPDTLPKPRLHLLQRRLPEAASRADAIIVPSMFVKREVVSCLDVAEEKIHVVMHGVNDEFHHIGIQRPNDRLTQHAAHVLTRWRLKPNHYVLCVATPEPRKNLMNLLDAWFLLPPAVRSQNTLVLVGAAGWKNQKLQDRLQFIARRDHRHGRVLTSGYVPERDLPALYAHAAGLVMPSLYEGFGLPVAEAMACGLPTAIATGSALDELASPSALRFAPNDLTAMSEALQQMLTDPTWQNRCAAVNRKKAQAWRWERCAKETLAVYQKLVSTPPAQ